MTRYHYTAKFSNGEEITTRQPDSELAYAYLLKWDGGVKAFDFARTLDTAIAAARKVRDSAPEHLGLCTFEEVVSTVQRDMRPSQRNHRRLKQ